MMTATILISTVTVIIAGFAAPKWVEAWEVSGSQGEDVLNVAREGVQLVHTARQVRGQGTDAMRTLATRGENEDSVLSIPSGAVAEEERMSASAQSQFHCEWDGQVVRHGQSVTLSSASCWTRLCWYGALYDNGDGCHVGGRCYGIDEIFELDCVTLKQCRDCDK